MNCSGHYVLRWPLLFAAQAPTRKSGAVASGYMNPRSKMPLGAGSSVAASLFKGASAIVWWCRFLRVLLNFELSDDTDGQNELFPRLEFVHPLPGAANGEMEMGGVTAETPTPLRTVPMQHSEVRKGPCHSLS